MKGIVCSSQSDAIKQFLVLSYPPKTITPNNKVYFFPPSLCTPPASLEETFPCPSSGWCLWQAIAAPAVHLRPLSHMMGILLPPWLSACTCCRAEALCGNLPLSLNHLHCTSEGWTCSLPTLWNHSSLLPCATCAAFLFNKNYCKLLAYEKKKKNSWTIILRISSNYQLHHDCFKEKIMHLQWEVLAVGWEEGKKRLKYCSCFTCCFLPLKEILWYCCTGLAWPDLLAF